MPFGVARHNFREPTPAIVSAVIPTTWNPADIQSGATLSGGNLTATSSTSAGGNFSGRSVDSITSGQKVFFSFVLNVDSAAFSNAFGIATSAFTFGTGNYVGIGATSLGFFFSGGGAGNVYTSGAPVSGIALTAVAGDVVDVAIDATANQLYWFRINGGNWNGSGTDNPATATGGKALPFAPPFYPAFNMWTTGGLVTSNSTTNFGGSAYSFAPPSGFSNVGH